ncbi:Non-heme 11 kDa protein of cytochrome bc1 complex [Violaceomyces palustris]|uniref:Non-heme 11 kDa protein of cytochrome bc1 complex n=1 Tax=Violaceomyces palustris TaxID=1673888 RepID=A0ACD0P6G5_9BASI|nr:Non-heme 11 kDa protein of cytochrome bc1 complex [Violaceomyces palustris]
MSAVTSTTPVESIFGNVTSFVTSLFPVAHAEEEKEESEEQEGAETEGADEEEEDEEEEDEPAPAIYEECENSKKCAPAKHHFDECQARVEAGKGFEGENCIEEFFHLAHCAQECTAPKLFSKLV